MDSILNSIKKMLGINPEYTDFDTDIIIDINMVFNILLQLGVGPSTGFSITDSTAEWSDYIQDMSKLEMVKTYVYLKVKQIFDPGTSSSLNSAIEDQLQELEWRLNIQVDPGE